MFNGSFRKYHLKQTKNNRNIFIAVIIVVAINTGNYYYISSHPVWVISSTFLQIIAVIIGLDIVQRIFGKVNIEAKSKIEVKGRKKYK